MRSYFLIAFLFVSLVGFSQNIIYVDASATGSNNGSSWGNAFTSLQDALMASNEFTDTIKIASGTYKPSALPPGATASGPRDVTFFVSEGITIAGGYPNGGGEINPANNPTILSGDIGVVGDRSDNAHHVLMITQASVTLFGLIIERGNANGSDSLTTISGKVSRKQGGGLFTKDNTIELFSLVFRNNYADLGGGVTIQGGNMELVGTVFDQNNAFRGGGLYAVNSIPVALANTVFYKNNSTHAGGGFVNSGSSFVMDHCTFVENSAGLYAGAVLNSLADGNRVTNTIFAGNYFGVPANLDKQGADFYDSVGTTDFRNSLLQRLRTCDDCIITNTAQLVQQNDGDGADNAWGTADDGVAVSPLSDAFKAGRLGYVLQDINQNPRNIDSLFDIGAYETNALGFIAGNVIYVDSAATGANNGSSWANALTSLQAAINIAASSNGTIDTIKIAKGTYQPSSFPRRLNMFEDIDQSKERTFHLPSNIVLIGGFASGGLSRDIEVFPTILSSTNYHVVTTSYGNNITLDGLTIRNGNSNGPGNAFINGQPQPRNFGGGIIAVNTSLVLKHCKFIGNRTSEYGGAIACNNSMLSISDCYFSENYGGMGGGGLYALLLMPGSSMVRTIFNNNSCWQFGAGMYIKINPNIFLIDSCRFTNNYQTLSGGNTAGGGGIYCNEGANIKVTSCHFESNTGHLGSGIMVNDNAYALIKNGVFVNNIANRSGAVASRSYQGITLINLIFIRNKAAHQGGGFYTQWDASVDNCLFFENSAMFGGGGIMSTGVLYLKNSVFYGNLLQGSSIVAGADVTASSQLVPYSTYFQVYAHPDFNLNNLLGPFPLFADTTDFDGPDNRWLTADDGLRPQLVSPLINQGKAAIDSNYIDTDITGGPRVRDGFSEMGPYEVEYCTAIGIQNKTLYVDSAATGSRTGGSWANAYNDLESAIIAKRCGCTVDTIKIAKGTYVPRSRGDAHPLAPNTSKSDFVFYLPDSTVFLGGYPSGGGERNHKFNPTILSGYDAAEQFPNKAHVVFFKYANAIFLDGLIIEKGGFGPGDDPQVIDGETIARHEGKAIYAVGSKVSIRNCIIRNNSGGEGAVKMNFCTGNIINTVFEGNLTSGIVAAVYTYSSPVTFSNCIFSNNVNALFYTDHVLNEGPGPVPRFIHCTFFNSASDKFAIAGANSSHRPYVSNSLFWGSPNEFDYPNEYGERITYSLFQGFEGGINNLQGRDPILVNPADPDGLDNIWGTADDGLRIQNTSPAINQAHNDSIPPFLSTDFAGNPRVNGGVSDMGAYECDCFPATYVNHLIPLSTAETASNTSNNCGTWQFVSSGSDNNKYILEINKNGNALDPSLINVDATTNVSHQRILGTDFTTVAFRMVSITAPGSYTQNGGVGLRIYFDSSEITSLPGIYRTWFKHNGNNKTAVLNDLTFNHLSNAVPIVPSSTGKVNNISYVEFRNITSFSTFGYLVSSTAGGVVPVNFLSFTATKKNRTALLHWKAEKELDNLRYEVQRSTNNKDWLTIATVKPDTTTSLVKNYHFIDSFPPPGICYYRIKQVDYNFAILYSQVRVVRFNEVVSEISVQPNPARQFINIVSSDKLSGSTYSVTDVAGRVVLTGKLAAGLTTRVEIESLKAGLYWVVINNKASGKFIVVK